MSAKAYSLPPAKITSTISDLVALVEFFRDKDAMDELFKTAIEQQKLSEDECSKAQEARKVISLNETVLANIQESSDKLTKQQQDYKKNIDDFDAFKAQEELRLDTIKTALDINKYDLEKREKNLSLLNKKLQDDMDLFEKSKQENELKSSNREDMLLALEKSIEAKKSALDAQDKAIQEKFDKLKSIIG